MNGNKEKHVPLLEFLRRHPVLAELAVITVMANTCYMMMVAMVPLYFRGTFHIRHDALIGVALSAFVFSEMLMKPAAGLLGDRFHRIWLVIVALLLASITPHIISHANTPVQFIVVRLFDGIGAALLWPAMIALFADTTAEKDRATAMSVFTLCISISAGLGMTLSPFIKQNLGSYDYVFGFIGIVMGMAFVAMLAMGRSVSRAAVFHTKADLFPGGGEAEVVPGRGLKALAKDPAVLRQIIVLGALAFTQMLGTSALNPVTQLFAKDKLKWAEGHLWIAFAAMSVVIALMSLAAGRLADRIGKETAVKASFALSGICLIVLAISKQPWAFVFAAVSYGISFVVGAPAWMALVTRGEWKSNRGVVLGFVTALQGAGAVIGPIVGTEIYNDFGPYASYAVTGSLLMLCAVVAMFVLKPIKNNSINS